MRNACVLRCALGFAWATAGAVSARADVIFDNGPPNPETGGVLSDLDAGNFVGDDFVLAPTGSTINALRWWGFHVAVPTLADDFTVEIRELVLGVPADVPIWSLHAGSVPRTEIEPLVHVYDLEIDPLPLAADEPFVLVVRNHSGPGTDDDWSWYTSGEGSAFGWLGDEPPVPISRDFAFVLSGPLVPAPGAGAAGLLALAAARRRRD